MPTIQSCRLVDVNMGYSIQGGSDVSLKYHITTDEPVNSIVDYQTILNQSFAATPSPAPVLYADIGGGSYALRHQLAPRNEHTLTRLTLTVSCGKLPAGQSPTFGQTQEQIDDPRKRPFIFWNERISETRLVDKNIAGEPIVNAAGQPFDEPIVDEEWMTVLVAQRNYGTLEEIEQLNRNYRNTVNLGSFRQNPTKTVRFTGIETGPPQFENGVTYWVGQLRFLIRPAGWAKSIVNRGFKHFTEAANPADRVLVNATEQGQPVTEPVLLTADGRRLPQGEVGNFVTAEIYTPVDYAPLLTNPS